MATDIFAKVGDIEGESTDDRHAREIDVLSFSWGMANASGPTSTGAASGKTSFQDLTFIHKVDKATPHLMRVCATGKHLPEAVITQRKAGRGSPEYLTIKMTDVVVTSVATSAAIDPPGTETVTLSFVKVQFEYVPQKADGSLDAAVVFKYDLKANREG